MKNQIPANVKEFRSKKLLELSDLNERGYLEQYIGKEVDVLFEEKDGEYLKGHTGNYILVKAKLDEQNLNKIIRVNVLNVEKDCLIAE